MRLRWSHAWIVVGVLAFIGLAMWHGGMTAHGTPLDGLLPVVWLLGYCPIRIAEQDADRARGLPQGLVTRRVRDAGEWRSGL